MYKNGPDRHSHTVLQPTMQQYMKTFGAVLILFCPTHELFVAKLTCRSSHDMCTHSSWVQSSLERCGRIPAMMSALLLTSS